MSKTEPENAERVTTLKKILCAGKGELPNYCRDTKAIFHYEVFLPPKTNKLDKDEIEDAEQARLTIFPQDRSLYECIDSTKKDWPNGYGKPLELIFGKKFQLPLFEKCLRTMLVDEISQFDVYDPNELITFPMVSKKLRDIGHAEKDPIFAKKYEHSQKHQCAATVTELGYPELDKLLKEGPRPTRVILHLLQVLKPDQYKADNWQLDEVQRSKQIDQLRIEGNQLFSEKDYQNASLKYREAITLLDQLLLNEKPGDPEWLELDRRNIFLFLNLAQCFLNLGQFYEAINCANEVLNRDPKNVKALFRRAKAKMQIWDLEEAESDLHLLKSLGADVSLINSNLKQLEQKRKEKECEQSKAYKAMFKGVLNVEEEK
uniref:AIP/AIPL N-terminal FKBP-type PPIase domain-containing protein n=1 Tax=Meloidogyne javanica TaxID=6303 RepID=A0A915MII1_MELJA